MCPDDPDPQRLFTSSKERDSPAKLVMGKPGAQCDRISREFISIATEVTLHMDSVTAE